MSLDRHFTLNNRLSQATSPYLLQHARNPVKWQPWDQEALEQAKREDKPIFLSIGYSACHWCHVMERESFENEAIARLLNEHFIPIKVDREERPDLDEIYMEAVQAMTGRGGWPMSVFLAPDLKPFYGATYIPPEPRFGSPGFGDLLQRIAQVWKERKADILHDAGLLAEEVRQRMCVPTGDAVPGQEIIEKALGQLRSGFDPRWGGFSPAPKFPAHMAIELILRRGSKKDMAMVVRTLDAMADGGMYDQLGGGFARYSVDERWIVPHFEKMLYDNALLACCYIDAFRATGQERFARIARETLDYLLRDMRDDAGGFHSSEDADSDGEEGRFYTWTPGEVSEVLGSQDGELFSAAFGVKEPGFLEGRSVLRRIPIDEELSSVGLSRDEFSSKLAVLRERMRIHRESRTRPQKDDKVIASWNGLALSALARGYAVFKDVRYGTAAKEMANFMKSELWNEAVLVRSWRNGAAGVSGLLEDYAALILGLVDLYEADFDAAWLSWAEDLATAMAHRFEDTSEGGFFTSEADRSDLLVRSKVGIDAATPSGNSLAIIALLRLGSHLDREDLLHSAERALTCFAPGMIRAPRAHLAMLAALDRYHSGCTEVVVSGDPEGAVTRALIDVAHRAYLPNGLISLVEADASLSLGQDRSRSASTTVVHVCTNRTCSEPIVSADALAMRLSRK